MAIGTQDDSDQMLSEINMIPFIDVMLVLLIIFIITVPVIKHAVNIDLPQASNQKAFDKPDNVRLSIDAEGDYFWNDAPVADAELDDRLAAAAALPTATRAAHSRPTRTCATSAWPWPWPPPSARDCARSASSPSPKPHEAKQAPERSARASAPCPRAQVHHARCPAKRCCAGNRRSRLSTTASSTACKPRAKAS